MRDSRDNIWWFRYYHPDIYHFNIRNFRHSSAERLPESLHLGFFKQTGIFSLFANFGECELWFLSPDLDSKKSCDPKSDSGGGNCELYPETHPRYKNTHCSSWSREGFWNDCGTSGPDSPRYPWIEWPCPREEKPIKYNIPLVYRVQNILRDSWTGQ